MSYCIHFGEFYEMVHKPQNQLKAQIQHPDSSVVAQITMMAFS